MTRCFAIFTILVLLLQFCLTAKAGTLDDVRSAGVLHCGVDDVVPGFSAARKDDQWVGFAADFCRALAILVIGDGRKVAFTLLKPDERLEALQSGEIDVLVAALPIAMALEKAEGLLFSDPLYFDDSSGEPLGYGAMVRQSDDNWFLTVNGLRHVLIANEIFPQNVKDKTQLPYGQMFEHNFGAVPRGKNQHVSRGGWLWTPLP